MGEVVKMTEESPLAPVPLGAIVAQVKAIREVMRNIMKAGEDYGTVPGTDKPVLMKAGAEKLAFYFRLGLKYDVQIQDLPGGHKNVVVRAEVRSLRTGELLGEGVGSCSTLESKYRYRFEDVGPVPKEYWACKDPSALGEPDLLVRKKGSEWRLFRRLETEPADFYNTVLKMAKKRAYVDAILSVTAASELFTQDIEEIVEGEVVNGTHPATASTPPRRDDQSGRKIPNGTDAHQTSKSHTPDWWHMKAPEFLRLYARTDEASVSAWSPEDRKLWKRKCDEGVRKGLPTWWPKEYGSNCAEQFARLLDLGMGLEEAAETAKRANWDPETIDLLIEGLAAERQASQTSLF